jgi:hypothetical protein
VIVFTICQLPTLAYSSLRYSEPQASVAGTKAPQMANAVTNPALICFPRRIWQSKSDVQNLSKSMACVTVVLRA